MVNYAGEIKGKKSREKTPPINLYAPSVVLYLKDIFGEKSMKMTVLKSITNLSQSIAQIVV